MNQKIVKLLRKTFRAKSATKELNRKAYLEAKKALKPAPLVVGGKPHPFLQGIPSEGSAIKFKDFKDKQPNYGPVIVEKGAGRDRKKKVKGPTFQLPFGLSPLMLNMFTRVGLILEV